MTTFAITGGLGFLGFNLARHLASKGNNIILLDNMSRKGTENNLNFLREIYPADSLGAKIKFIPCEIEDMPNILQKHNIDLIYHFAAQVAVTKSYESPASDFRINAEGTFNILRSTDVPVILTSTNKVYGDNVNNISIKEKITRYEFRGEEYKKGIPENFPVDAGHHTPYGASKLTGDIYTREFGGVVNRCSCMVGPFQYGNSDQGWVAHFIISMLKNNPITIYGDGKQVRDILYVDDMVRLLELQASNIHKIRGCVFNVGGGYKNTISLLELCKMLNIKPSFKDWRPADQKVYYSDISKAKKLLDWEPEISPKAGINKLLEWWKQHSELLTTI